MHSLLKRILRKYFGDNFQIPDEWQKFISAVNESYIGYDQDIKLLERSLDLSSHELVQANSHMNAIFKAVPDIFFRLNRDGIILEVKAGENAEFFISPKSLINKKIQDIPDDKVAGQFQEAIEQITAHKEIIRFDYSALVNDKQNFYEARFFPLAGDQIIAIIRDITEQKAAEEALRQSEEKYRVLYLELDKYKNHLEVLINVRTEKLRETEQRYTTIFSRASDSIIIFDAFGLILEVNEGACVNLNYSSSELLKLSYNDIEKDFDENLFRELTASIIDNGSISTESLHKRKDGSVFPVDSRYSCFMADYKYHFVMISRDISERKRKEEEIRKLYKAVVQSPATVVITNSSGQIEFVNPSFELITGYSAAEALNQKPGILKSGIHTEDFYRDLWQTLIAGKEWTGEFCNRKKNGELYWEHASISPVKNEFGEISHFVAVKLDITERKTLIKTLEQAKQTAESATRIKSNFVANMS
ncbi:MAG: PAS domain S-box protein, partial [Syntrophothermus sp.]